MAELKAVAKCANGTRAYVDAYPSIDGDSIDIDIQYISDLDWYAGTTYNMTVTQARKVANWILNSIDEVLREQEVNQ